MSKLFKPLYLQYPTEVLHDPKVCDGDVLVYSVILWYHSLKDGICRASNQAISAQSRKSIRTIEKVLTRLENAGHIKRYYDESGKRIEIRPLTSLGYVKTRRGVRSEAENPTHGSVQSNNKIENKDTNNISPHLKDVVRAYFRIKSIHHAAPSDWGRIGKAVKLIAGERGAGPDLIIKGFEWLSGKDFNWTAETLNKLWHEFIKDANIMPSNKKEWTDEQWARYISTAPTTGLRIARQNEHEQYKRGEGVAGFLGEQITEEPFQL